MSATAPDTRPRAGRIVIENFRPTPTPAAVLRGFADVTMPDGMILYRCTVFMKDGHAWAAPPSKQIIERDGSVSRTPDGKVRYEPTVSFVDRATTDRWSKLVIEALKISHPEALA
jgi:hypothetical protein